MIPEHLRKNQESRDSDNDSSSDAEDFGPKLPSVGCKGPDPTQPPPVQQQQDDEDDEEEAGNTVQE